MRWLAALAPAALGAQLQESCAKALEAIIMNADLNFWMKRATDHCSLKFQNQLQVCCSPGGSGVIPLLEKQELVNNSRYGGWRTLFSVPLEYKDRYTPSPTPPPTTAPTRERVAVPTPSPTIALSGTAPADDVISEVVTTPPSPVPTAFENIKPPPLPTEIGILAAPAAPIMFALGGGMEGGVDLSGSGERPPAIGEKRCSSGCTVDCRVAARAQVCNDWLGTSCELKHKPLPNFEVMTNLYRLPDGADGKTAAMLTALSTLEVKEDFCMPDECNNPGDRRAIVYAYFTRNRDFPEEYMTIECPDGSLENIMLALGVVSIFLILAYILYMLLVPPKMPTEYIVRRSEDGGQVAS